MVFSILVIAVFIICNICVNYRNRITWIFSAYFIGIGILMFASLLYVAKLSNYYYSLDIDYYLYLILSDVKFGIPDTARIYNFGIATIMLASVLFYITIKNPNTIVKFFLFSVILLFLFANDPAVSFNAFIEINSFEPSSKTKLVAFLVRLNQLCSVPVLIAYMLLPFYAIYLYCIKTRIILKLRFSLVVSICLFIVDIFIFSFFIRGPFSNFLASSVDLLKFPLNELSWNYYIIVLPVVIFVLLVVLYLTFYYKPFNTLTVLTQKDLNKNSRLLNKNLRMVFHVYKNLFFAIERMSEQGSVALDKNKAVTEMSLNEINKISKHSITTISRMLDMLSDLKTVDMDTDIVSCVNEALNKVSIPGNVKIIKDIKTQTAQVRGDAFHLTECFVNLFLNAFDAINIKHNKYPFVKVSIFCEDGLVSVEILDNGCGISKKNIKNIYKVLYSTKQNSNNWGVGLNYVDKVLRMSRGYIFVRSKENRYTWFQVVLPLTSTKKGGEKWIK